MLLDCPDPLALAFNLFPRKRTQTFKEGLHFMSSTILFPISGNSLTWRYSVQAFLTTGTLTSGEKAQGEIISHIQHLAPEEHPSPTLVHTFNSARLLFVTAGEGLLFSPSVAHREVSMRSKRGMQRARRIVLYSFLKFWLSSPYMMALRQLLKYAMK